MLSWRKKKLPNALTGPAIARLSKEASIAANTAGKQRNPGSWKSAVAASMQLADKQSRARRSVREFSMFYLLAVRDGNSTFEHDFHGWKVSGSATSAVRSTVGATTSTIANTTGALRGCKSPNSRHIHRRTFNAQSGQQKFAPGKWDYFQCFGEQLSKRGKLIRS